MEQEHTVQHAFRATAALFRALGISQDTASRELGLRGHTSFSFWKQGRQEFDSRYAVALYKLVVEGVNARRNFKLSTKIFANVSTRSRGTLNSRVKVLRKNSSSGIRFPP